MTPRLKFLLKALLASTVVLGVLVPGIKPAIEVIQSTIVAIEASN